MSDPVPSHPFDLALSFLGDGLRRDEPMGPLCTYRVGGHAARFIEVESVEQLKRIAEGIATADVDRDEAASRVYVVGKGSNLLVAERGLPGLVLRLGAEFDEIDIPEERGSEPVEQAATVVVTVGGAASLPVVARRTVAAGLGGFEWAVGVPGSIGGAVRMNAGGHGADMSSVLDRVRVVNLLTGEDVWVEAQELELGYRRSSLLATDVVTQAELSLVRSDPQAGDSKLKEIVRWRRENQPGGANAGSVFTNPSGKSAGQLIDEAGCKGLRLGTAAVSDKHANFIQADIGGSADDVVAVMKEVIRRVEDHSGYRLHPETVLLGFDEVWPSGEASVNSDG
ncbi:MAG TPA: UDP-N-acetylmuramate dehydrogenase [Microthrixaceae bacterium]|nr:UDP-N-acetylmuramate dehydrogenase [Microthrixaceae bacterium]